MARKHPIRRRRSPMDMLRGFPDLTPPPDRKWRRPRDKDEGGVPVEPDNPRNLSGGAAAELEFDD